MNSLLKLSGVYNTDELLKHQNCEESCCKTEHLDIVPEKYLKTGKRGQRPLNPKYVYWFMAKEGFTALSEYVNNSTPLEFRCPVGHVHSMRFSDFQQGKRCKICKNEKHGELLKHTHEYVEKYMSDRDYTLLSKYVNNRTPLQFRCPVGHVHSMRFGHFQQGHRCKICKNEKQSESQKLTHEYVEKYFEKHGYTLLSKYVNNSTPVKFRCPMGHVHSMCFSDFQRGGRCGKCFEETLKGCTNLTAYTILQRTIQRGSTIPEDDLRKLIELEILPKIQKFYSSTPSGHHVDHIIPFSFFDHNDKDQIRACWSLYNLRYLSATQNISRGNRFDIDDIEKMPLDKVNHLIAIAVNASNTPKDYKEAIKHLMIFDSVESDYDDYWEEIIKA